jgi:hypothetical protein
MFGIKAWMLVFMVYFWGMLRSFRPRDTLFLGITFCDNVFLSFGSLEYYFSLDLSLISLIERYCPIGYRPSLSIILLKVSLRVWVELRLLRYFRH